jgi:hypothetical protein
MVGYGYNLNLPNIEISLIYSNILPMRYSMIYFRFVQIVSMKNFPRQK